MVKQSFLYKAFLQSLSSLNDRAKALAFKIFEHFTASPNLKRLETTEKIKERQCESLERSIKIQERIIEINQDLINYNEEVLKSQDNIIRINRNLLNSNEEIIRAQEDIIEINQNLINSKDQYLDKIVEEMLHPDIAVNDYIEPTNYKL